VVPAALYRTGDRLHRVLRGYKDASAVTARQHFARCLGVHLAEFVYTHGPCIERAAGATWDSIAVVPSSTRTPDDRPRVAPPAGHPLSRVVTAMSCLSALRRVDIGRGSGTARHLAPSRHAFVVGAEARGRRVLLFDDTWVTGARARSAAAALGHAGAEVVAVIVAGRAVGAVESAPAAGVATWWHWAEGRAARRTELSAARGRASSKGPCCVVPCLGELSTSSRDH
jgi:predicted amidophosphoribosyltransferase